MTYAAPYLPKGDLESRLWSFGILCLAAASFPAVLAGTAILYAWSRLTSAPPAKAEPNGKTVIITGGKMTKSLHTARILKRAGTCNTLQAYPAQHCAAR